MAYTKVIMSGTLVEEWTYDFAPNPSKSRKRPTGGFDPSRERRVDNIIKCRNSFRRLVRANLSSSKPPALLTLTMRDIVSVASAYTSYTRFGVLLRRKYGKEIKTIGVPEFQKRGAVHFHVLIWGLPLDLPCLNSRKRYYDENKQVRRRHVCPIYRSCERRTRALADIWGEGFADVIETDGSVALSGYLAKYMSKAMHDIRLVGKRAYSASRNAVRPVSLNRPFDISFAYDMWGITGDNSVVLRREYDTLFLGRCVYKNKLIPP